MASAQKIAADNRVAAEQKEAKREEKEAAAEKRRRDEKEDEERRDPLRKQEFQDRMAFERSLREDDHNRRMAAAAKERQENRDDQRLERQHTLELLKLQIELERPKQGIPPGNGVLRPRISHIPDVQLQACRCLASFLGLL